MIKTSKQTEKNPVGYCESQHTISFKDMGCKDKIQKIVRFVVQQTPHNRRRFTDTPLNKPKSPPLQNWKGFYCKINTL